MTKEHVLVTGGAGYLGSNLVPALLNEGYKVTVLDNFMFKQHSLGHVCVYPDFEVIRGDVRDYELVKKVLADKNIIFPLAALVGAPLCNADPVAAKTVNLEAQLAMYDMLRDDQKVIVPITNSGYGIGEEGKFCTEETPMRPISTYGIHKVEVEKRALARENTISFRLATVFGISPRMRLDLLVNDFVYRAFYDRAVVLFESHFKRNYIHNRDVTNAFLHGLKNFETMKGQAFNLGLSEANLSKKELCEKIAQHLPGFVFMEAEIGEDPDKRDYIVSNEKLEKTGWQRQYSLDMGIQELIKGYTMIRNSQYGNV